MTLAQRFETIHRTNLWGAESTTSGLGSEDAETGVLGTGLATIIYYFIIDKLGAVSASSLAYIPPVVAMVIGVVLVSEPINAWEYLGAVLIMGGLVLVNRRPREKV
ncbi:MAG: hypothetical protein CMM46_06535 [Rhodospirillaceae bacterium]|nr:hypothetical protein [Rhodospirillaceae bacterium]